MDNQIIPTKKGQIVKIVNPLDTDNPDESYLLAEDPMPYDNTKRLVIYSITDILRNKESGEMIFADMVMKGDLTVVGESLENWVHNWNYKSN